MISSDDQPQRQAAIEALERKVESLRERQETSSGGDETTLNLYVAAYRLREAFHRGEGLAALREIVANLIGSEEFGVFTVDAVRAEMSLVLAYGMEPDPLRAAQFGRGIIGKVVETGEPFVAARDSGGQGNPIPEEALLSVCIPLRRGEHAVLGALAVFRLLPQKAKLEEVDYALFDLLASHGGLAVDAVEGFVHEPARRPRGT